jgi:hypothetical protein
MVCRRSEKRGGSLAETAGAALSLGRGDGPTPAVIRGEEVEELGRLGHHRAGSFCSMNLTGSKLIERSSVLSSEYCRIAVSSR